MDWKKQLPQGLTWLTSPSESPSLWGNRVGRHVKQLVSRHPRSWAESRRWKPACSCSAHFLRFYPVLGLNQGPASSTVSRGLPASVCDQDNPSKLCTEARLLCILDRQSDDFIIIGSTAGSGLLNFRIFIYTWCNISRMSYKPSYKSHLLNICLLHSARRWLYTTLLVYLRFHCDCSCEAKHGIFLYVL